MSFMVIPGDLAFYRILGGVYFLFFEPQGYSTEQLPLLKYIASTN